MISQLIFLAQESAPAPKGSGGGLMQTLFFLGLIFMVFYWLILRPQKKKEQQRRQMLSQVRKGDQVRTIGGIFGEVASVKEKFVIINVDKQSGATLKVSRSAVSAIIAEESDEKSEE